MFSFPLIKKSWFLAVFFLLSISLGLSSASFAQCEIGEIEATPTPCDSMGFFNLVMNFEYTNVGTDGFTVEGNGMIYGTYEYTDLPIIIYDLEGDGITFYEFVVRDAQTPDCNNFIEFGTFDCDGGDCLIWNVDVFPQPCDGGFFYVQLGFWYENTGDQGFRVQGNGNNYGNFEYDDLPITIGPLEGDGITEYEFVVIDNEIEDCSDWSAIDPVECPGTGDCDIWDLVIDDHPCDSGMFNVYLDFEYENVGDSGFALYVNYDLFGYYFYEELPLENIGPFLGDGSTVYHFLVVDQTFENCAEDLNFGPIECDSIGDCHIWDLVIDDHPCDGGMYNVLLDFEYENVSEEGFALYVNYDLLDEYSYADLPLESIGPFEGDGSTVYHFMVVDLSFDECAEDANFGPIECDSIGDCEIGDINVTILPCNEIDEFNVLLDFVHVNTGDEFTVQGNGMMYGTYLYTDLPVEIGPLMGDGTTIYEFAVIDVLYNDCAEDTYIDPVSCDSLTEFINYKTEVISCNEDNYELKMEFEVLNGGSQGFNILGNGEDYGSYSYDQLPVTIGPLSTDGLTAYHFIAKDKESPQYGNWDKLIPFTCESLGLDEPSNLQETVIVYPNPSYGSLVFENLNDEVLTVHLYNSAGATTSTFILENTYQIDGIAAGIYYYRIVGNKGVLSSGKIIVTR